MTTMKDRKEKHMGKTDKWGYRVPRTMTKGLTPYDARCLMDWTGKPIERLRPRKVTP